MLADYVSWENLIISSFEKLFMWNPEFSWEDFRIHDCLRGSCIKQGRDKNEFMVFGGKYLYFK